jgi:hypothetical protein
MDNVWLASALWIGLALIASVLSIWVAISVALTEIIVGAVAGNLIGLPLAPGSTSSPGSVPSCSRSSLAPRSILTSCAGSSGQA